MDDEHGIKDDVTCYEGGFAADMGQVLAQARCLARVR